MGAVAVLADFQSRGFRFTADKGRLIVRPANRLTATDSVTIAAAKPGLLAELTGHPAYSQQSGWPGVTFTDGTWLATPPPCKASGAATCPVPPWCSHCPEKDDR